MLKVKLLYSMAGIKGSFALRNHAWNVAVGVINPDSLNSVNIQLYTTPIYPTSLLDLHSLQNSISMDGFTVMIVSHHSI
jgi:hypothetical protein